MGVIDELVRQERVQQRLDGRVRRGRIDQVGPLQRHHVFVSERLQLPRLQQRRELHGREACGLDGAHVPAAALDAEHVPAVADEIGRNHLARRIAAAVQDEARLATEQTRRVDAQRQIALDALRRIGIDDFLGVLIIPKTLHRPSRT